MEKRISDIKDGNLDMIQMKEETDISVKNKQKNSEISVTPSDRET